MTSVRTPVGHGAIVAAARKEFSARGYSATSIRDIATRAGLSLSALYYYYKGKQELLAAILDQDLGEYFTATEEALAAAEPDPASQLRALVGATVRFRATHPAESSIVQTEGRSLAPEHLARYQERQEQATDQFRRIIDVGIASGDFRTPYPDDARRTIIASCNAIAQWYKLGGPLSLDELIERYVALAFTIVEHRPSGRRP